MEEAGIQKWMSEQIPLVTGATGFLGKVIVEKLLRDCPGMQRVYILLRAKNDEDLAKRCKEFKDNMVFQRILKEDKNILDKVVPIKGDLGEVRLGISEENENLLKSEISVIIHSAAALRFDESIRESVLMNTRGTRELLNLAKNSPKFKSFVYVSTAYSNCYVNKIKEDVYPTPYDPDWMISMYEKNKDLHKDIEQSILQTYPNSYIFSKNLAEKMVYNFRDQLPVAIVRPSIITPSLAEPYPGWIDSRSSLLSFLVGGASGFVHSGYGNINSLADLLPVDLASNGAIAAAYSAGNTPVGDCPVYNLATGSDTPITWKRFLETEKEIFIENPLPNIFWYPNGTMYESYTLFVLNFILYQLLPALVYDFLFIIMLKKPFLVKMQLKAFKNTASFSFFVLKHFTWETRNTDNLHRTLNIKDRKLFNFKMNKFNFNKYFHDISLGIRRFMMKIDEKAPIKDKLKMKFYFLLDTGIKTVFYMGLTYWILRALHLFDLGPLEQFRGLAVTAKSFVF